jgi:hypothetical protein
MPLSTMEHGNEKIGTVPAAFGEDRLGRRTEAVAQIT